MTLRLIVIGQFLRVSPAPTGAIDQDQKYEAFVHKLSGVGPFVFEELALWGRQDCYRQS